MLNNYEYEKIVIEGLLYDNDALDRVKGIISSEDFYNSRYKKYFKEIETNN